MLTVAMRTAELPARQATALDSEGREAEQQRRGSVCAERTSSLLEPPGGAGGRAGRVASGLQPSAPEGGGGGGTDQVRRMIRHAQKGSDSDDDSDDPDAGW